MVEQARQRPKIICCMRIKNEEEWIGASLAQTSKLADSILILDDGSTDRTPEICRKFPKVKYRYYQRELEEVRDRRELISWAVAEGADWVLIMDGDEVLEESGPERILQAIEQIDPRCPQYTSFLMHILYFWDDPDIYRAEAGIYGQFWIPRLFTTWGQDQEQLTINYSQHGHGFHCSIIPSNIRGEGRHIDVCIKHYGYLQAAKREEKFRWYLARDPQAAASGYYNHLTSDEGMVRARWTPRSADKMVSARFMKLNHYFMGHRPEVTQYVPQKARTILDIGCGYGMLGRSLKTNRPDRLVVGIEYDQMAANAAVLQLDQVLVGDAETVSLPFKEGFFDCIIMADVLEHLYNPWDTLARYKKYLAPDGVLVASIPNVRNLNILRDLAEKGRWEYVSAGIMDSGHIRFFTVKDIKKLFIAAGYAINNMFGVSDPSVKLELPAGPEVPLIINTENMSLKNVDATSAREFKVVQFLVKAIPYFPPSTSSELTSIIIICLNGLDLTRACVTSILANTPDKYELIFVDNGSSDGTVEYLQSIPGAKVVSLSRNVGFAAAANYGLAEARGDYVLFLNNDTVVYQHWLTTLINQLARSPATGAVGPVSNYVGGAQLIQPVLTGNDLQFKNFAGQRLVEKINESRPTHFLSGFCLLVKRAVVEQIGGFDEQFFPGNFEDDDFCLRILLAGYNLAIADDVFVYHVGSRTFVREKLITMEHFNKNWERFKQKWHLPGNFPIQEKLNEHFLDLVREPFSREKHYVPVHRLADKPVD